MKHGRTLLFCALFGGALLCGLSLFGAAGDRLAGTTGEETAYRGALQTPTDDTSPFLSEQDVLARLSDRLDGVTEDVTVVTGTDVITVSGRLTAGEGELIDRWPELAPYRLVLCLARGQRVSVTAQVTFDAKKGYAVRPLALSVAGIALSTGDLQKAADRVATYLNDRRPPGLTSWRLTEGGVSRTFEQKGKEANP